MRQSLSTWKPAALGFSTILPYSAAFTCMKGMTVIVLMWEEAAIKDDVIEYDIAFNIIYIMRTNGDRRRKTLFLLTGYPMDSIMDS